MHVSSRHCNTVSRTGVSQGSGPRCIFLDSCHVCWPLGLAAWYVDCCCQQMADSEVKYLWHVPVYSAHMPRSVSMAIAAAARPFTKV